MLLCSLVSDQLQVVGVQHIDVLLAALHLAHDRALLRVLNPTADVVLHAQVARVLGETAA